MGYPPDDLDTDSGYWNSLLKDADVWDTERPSSETSVPTETQSQESVKRFAGRNDLPGPTRTFVSEPALRTAEVPSAEMWGLLHEAMDRGTTLDVEAIGCNRGGLIVRYHTLRGFIPSSHLTVISPEMDEPTRRTVLGQQIGQEIQTRVIELDPERDRIVFSERAVTEDVGREPPSLLQEIRAGETRHGRVTNLTAFGAFVDLGGYEGLVHVSEISWSRVGHPRDVLAIGQPVQVYVMSVDAGEGRVALSLKRTKPDPWFGIEKRYHVGQSVTGVVTNVVDFGVFVKVEDDLEGLIHVSELAEGNFLHPRNIVREGETVTGRVIGVDGSLHRLALSLRNLNH
ncbi:MAG TPA: S1 RNA-binding domain-containing protein [Anaerolineae bacterium]